MKKLLFLSVLFAALLFGSCATGSAIIVGQARATIDSLEVKIYPELPQNYEIIAIVTASSGSGWTPQDDYQYAIKELKRQTANVGANGIVIESIGTVSSFEHFVTGKAIFVQEEE